MKRFHDSTSLLDNDEALRIRFHLNGYLFLKGIVDQDTLLSLRRQIVSILAKSKWLHKDANPMDAIPGTAAYVEGEEQYLQVYDEIQKLEAFHALPHQLPVLNIFQKLLGNTAFPHPLSIARIVFPDNDEWSTPLHQDYPNNQGTEDLYACWIPLADCPQENGSLSVLEGSHKFGVLPLEFALGAGHRRAVLDTPLKNLEWVGGDFELGDLIIFHSLTVHRSLHNSSDRIRLSVDYRFQREQEPLTEPCLKPHFQRLSWEQIYANWSSHDLAFYWRDKEYELVDWDSSMHEISQDEEIASIKETLRYDRKREKLRASMQDSSQQDDQSEL